MIHPWFSYHVYGYSNLNEYLQDLQNYKVFNNLSTEDSRVVHCKPEIDGLVQERCNSIANTL